jgi:hypothetical protein
MLWHPRISRSGRIPRADLTPVPVSVTISVSVPISIMFTIVAVPVVIPVVIVLNPAVISLPVAFKKKAAVVMRRNPTSAGVWCPRPISVMPFVVISYGIPVALDPQEIGPWVSWRNPHHAGRRWWSDSDSYRNLSGQHRATGQR